MRIAADLPSDGGWAGLDADTEAEAAPLASGAASPVSPGQLFVWLWAPLAGAACWAGIVYGLWRWLA